MTPKSRSASAIHGLLLAGVLVLLVLFAPTAQAQVIAQPVVAHLALGWAEPIHDFGDSFGAGWLVSGGATFHPDAGVPLGLRTDLGYARFSVVDQTFESFEPHIVKIVDDGYTSMGNLSLDALYEFGGRGRMGGYAGAGVGMYSRDRTVKQRVVKGPPPFCDPLIQVCQTTTTIVTENDRLTTIGYDLSVALTFRLRSGCWFCIEARYHRMNSNPATEYLPIGFGYRW